MYYIKRLKLIPQLFFALLFIAPIAKSEPTFSAKYIELFVSNNKNEIDLQTAYNRLQGKEQLELQSSVDKQLQSYHIKQQKQENVLGVYQMSVDKNMTADNTEVLNLPSQQNISDAKIKMIANQLAILLHQDSVAVLFPSNQPIIGDIKVTFTNNLPTINQAIDLIHKKLPAVYSQAFTLHFSQEKQLLNFNSQKVAAIEWLGSKPKLTEIKAAFPNAKILTINGNAYLVYNNKNIQSL